MVSFANGGSLTPEDLALIEAIRSERSILAASRATGVSYRKCWLMVDALNRTFETPVFGPIGHGPAAGLGKALRLNRVFPDGDEHGPGA
jgi:molybdate transport repressor ModE-like protein